MIIINKYQVKLPYMDEKDKIRQLKIDETNALKEAILIEYNKREAIETEKLKPLSVSRLPPEFIEYFCTSQSAILDKYYRYTFMDK